MKVEYANKLKRIEDTIALKKTDRIPVVPLMLYFPMAHKGLTHEYVFKNPGSARRAMQETFLELGGFDAVFLPDFIWPSTGGRTPFAPMPRDMPGKNTPAGSDALSSFRQIEIMSHEDYDAIIDQGWNGFLTEYLPRATGRPLEKISASQERLMAQFDEAVRSWEEMGVPTLIGCVTMPPYDILVSCRSFEKFAIDVYRMPVKVKDVMEAMWEDVVKNIIDTVRVTGINRVMMAMVSTSGQYAPPRIFDEFDFPFIKRMVDRLLEEGITSIILHMDSDYSKNMDTLLDLPKGKCVLEVEYTIDMKALKDKVRGHHCIMGNVGPSWLVESNRQDVEAYVKKLMDYVGEGGGFILSTSCDCPLDAKFENVKAMLETGKNYQPRHYGSL